MFRAAATAWEKCNKVREQVRLPDSLEGWRSSRGRRGTPEQPAAARARRAAGTAESPRTTEPGKRIPQWMQAFEARPLSWRRNASCVPGRSLAVPYFWRKAPTTTGAAAGCTAAQGGSSPGDGGGDKVTLAQHRGAFAVVRRLSPGRDTFVTRAAWPSSVQSTRTVPQAKTDLEPPPGGITAPRSGHGKQLSPCLFEWDNYLSAYSAKTLVEAQEPDRTQSEVALTSFFTPPSLWPSPCQSLRALSDMLTTSFSTRRRASCDRALSRTCCHTRRLSTSEGGKRATSSICNRGEMTSSIQIFFGWHGHFVERQRTHSAPRSSFHQTTDHQDHPYFIFILNIHRDLTNKR